MKTRNIYEPLLNQPTQLTSHLLRSAQPGGGEAGPCALNRQKQLQRYRASLQLSFELPREAALLRQADLRNRQPVVERHPHPSEGALGGYQGRSHDGSSRKEHDHRDPPRPHQGKAGPDDFFSKGQQLVNERKSFQGEFEF